MISIKKFKKRDRNISVGDIVVEEETGDFCIVQEITNDNEIWGKWQDLEYSISRELLWVRISGCYKIPKDSDSPIIKKLKERGYLP